MAGNYVNFIETVSRKVGLAELGNVLVEAYQDIRDEEAKLEQSRYDGLVDTIDCLAGMADENGGLSDDQLEQLKETKDNIVVFGEKATKWINIADSILEKYGAGEAAHPAVKICDILHAGNEDKVLAIQEMLLGDNYESTRLSPYTARPYLFAHKELLGEDVTDSEVPRLPEARAVLHDIVDSKEGDEKVAILCDIAKYAEENGSETELEELLNYF